jgi:hypothetical protein
MKKALMLFAVTTILMPLRSALPQTLSDYVKQLKGDTLVIKTYDDMGGKANSLYWALVLDTVNVPAGRVYELQAGGVYPFNNVQWQNTALLLPFMSSARHPTVIVGSDPTPVVNNKDVNSAPPLICTDNAAMGWAFGINAGGDLTIKNCELVVTTNDGRNGIFFTGTYASNLHLVYDNCLFEHCAHWFVYNRSESNLNVTFRNCYFVNLNGQPCRRDGGVFISFGNQDTLLVENCTHIMTQGRVYKFMIYTDNYATNVGSYQFKRIIFNHNTFVNCAGAVFMNPGYQSHLTVTNNIFVNCDLQPTCDSLYFWDVCETDPDKLPMGLVNCAPFPASFTPMDRKILVDKNVAYWDPRFNDMVSTLIAKNVNGTANWLSQTVTMNTRTQAMFDDNAHYPYLTEGTWYKKLPPFTNPRDLLTSQVDAVKAFNLSTVDGTSFAILGDWRLINTGPDKHVYPDWPIPVDLSYSDGDLQTAGLSGFPLGDLNWFPTRKAAWLAQRPAEYKSLDEALNAGRLVTAVDNKGSQPAEFQLQQNYPNPFNPSTMISFSIPKASYVTLKVYNILGQEVATLLDDFKAPQTYMLKFDGTGLSSGVYIARLAAGDFSKSIKLILTR